MSFHMCTNKITYPQQNSYETEVQLIYKADMAVTIMFWNKKKIMFYCMYNDFRIISENKSMLCDLFFT